MNTDKCIEALNMEKAGYWDTAHELAQALDSKTAAWVHAYLHRVEGDLGNAAYWYRRAGKPECRTSLEEEWQHIFSSLRNATS